MNPPDERNPQSSLTPQSSDLGGSRNVSQEHWTQRITLNSQCMNCGTERAGKFCTDCGQKHLDMRLLFGALVKQLLTRLLNFESGLFHTFLCMFRRPGEVARDYVSGKQKPYVNPLTYFFLGAAMQLVALWLTQDVLAEQMRASFQQSREQTGEDVYQKLDQLFGQDAVEVIQETYFIAIQQAYAYAALLCFCFPFAALLMLLHSAAGPRFKMGETTVFSLFCFGHILIITGCLTPIASRIGPNVQVMMGIVTYCVFPQFAHTGFFPRGWVPRILTLVSTGFATVCFFTSVGLIFIVSVVVRAIWAAQFGN